MASPHWSAGRVSAQPILFWLSREAELLASRHVDRRRAIFCRRDVELLAALTREDACGLVWDVSHAMPARAPGVDAEVLNAMRSMPLLLRADWNPSAIGIVSAAASVRDDVRISHADSDDFIRELDRLVGNPVERGAEQAVIRRLLPEVPAAVADIVLVAIVTAKRRTSVSELATRCGSSKGALLYRLGAVKAASPGALLGRLTAQHAAWWRGVLGWSAKRTAVELGYSVARGSVALDHFVRNHAGTGLRAMTDPACFWSLLERSADLFRPSLANAHSTSRM